MKDIPPGLREHFRQHNRRAILLALGCLIGSIVSWLLVYITLMWAELLFLTATRGVDAPTFISIWPQFMLVAAVLLVTGAAVRRWKTHHEKFHIGLALFTLFSIPARMTFAVWENFSARVCPSEIEMEESWELLTLLREQKKIAQTELPAVLECDATRITFLLAITGLLDTDDYGGVIYHHLRNEQAERLIRRWTRSLQLED